MRRAVGVLATVVALALAGSAASAGTGDTLEAGIAKKKAGPYGPNLSHQIAPGTAKDFFVRVVNLTGTRTDVALTALLGTRPRYREKYFRGDRNITAKVASPDGFRFGLGALTGKQFRLRVRVTDTGGMLSPRCLTSRFDPEPPVGPDDEATVFLQLNGPCP